MTPKGAENKDVESFVLTWLVMSAIACTNLYLIYDTLRRANCRGSPVTCCVRGGTKSLILIVLAISDVVLALYILGLQLEIRRRHAEGVGEAVPCSLQLVGDAYYHYLLPCIHGTGLSILAMDTFFRWRHQQQQEQQRRQDTPKQRSLRRLHVCWSLRNLLISFCPWVFSMAIVLPVILDSLDLGTCTGRTSMAQVVLIYVLAIFLPLFSASLTSLAAYMYAYRTPTARLGPHQVEAPPPPNPKTLTSNGFTSCLSIEPWAPAQCSPHNDTNTKHTDDDDFKLLEADSEAVETESYQVEEETSQVTIIHERWACMFSAALLCLCTLPSATMTLHLIQQESVEAFGGLTHWLYLLHVTQFLIWPFLWY